MSYDGRDFLAFCVRYFGRRYLELGLGRFHMELGQLIKYDKVAIAAPRGHSKSTYFSFFYPIYLCLKYPGIKVMLVSSTGSLAEDWLFKIREEFDGNDLLVADFGEVEGKRWTNTELWFANGSIVQAKGATKQIRGFRPDVIVVDDLEDDEIVLSPERMSKLDDWFWNTLVQTLKGGQGQVIVIGTILHPESFLANLINHGRHGWKTKLYQAIDDDGVILWPEMYSRETLDGIKEEMGQAGFNQEYLNDPALAATQGFKEEWIIYKKLVEFPRHIDYYTTVDLAIEQGTKNDYTAVVTCGVDSDENLWVIDVVNRRMNATEIVDKIFDVFFDYDPVKIGIESVGFQKLISNEIKRQRVLRKAYPVIESLESGGRRKHLRIERLQPRFEHGKVFIKEGLKDLVSQLLRFPSPRAHDDIIDALAYQLDIIKPSREITDKMNPNCFDAVFDRRRKMTVRGGTVWGNHNVRVNGKSY